MMMISGGLSRDVRATDLWTRRKSRQMSRMFSHGSCRNSGTPV